jgi:glutaredoxin
MSNLVTIYSRHGCHLCEVAEATLAELKEELNFEIEIKYIDGSNELEKLYGHEVPVIHIDGEHHDFYKVDPMRFRSSLEKHRQRQ